MLHVHTDPAPGRVRVTLKTDGRTLYVSETETSNRNQVHVNALEADDLDALNLLDSVARTSFVNLELVQGDIHILRSAAGGGKTTCAVQLAANLAARHDIDVLCLCYNVDAARQGQERCGDNARVTFSTIDAVVRRLFPNLDDDDRVDLGDPVSVRDSVFRATGRMLSTAEARSMGSDLMTAFTLFDPSGLQTDEIHEEEYFAAGMRGDWFSFESLRARALLTTQWKNHMSAYPAIIIDEAQDLSPIMIRLFKKLHKAHFTCYIGDTNQSIYQFNSCSDIAASLPRSAYVEWHLYKTFRYGQSICDLVHRKRLTGSRSVSAAAGNTEICEISDYKLVGGAHVFLFRWWHQALTTAFVLLRKGRSVKLDAGKRSEIIRELALGTDSNYRLFNSFEPEELQTLVRDTYAHDDPDAPADAVHITSVHKFKGLEADTVRVHRTVLKATRDEEGSRCLAYVGLTRAKTRLIVPEKWL